jgi:cardiolipin synthase (CMP-forming)
MPVPPHKIKSRVFSVPNQLTFLRLGFLPFFIIAVHYNHYPIALALMTAAGLSDGLDGLLARKLNQKTALGAYLDPIADKVMLSSSYFVLALAGKIGWWLAILVLGRDALLLIACAAILLTVGYRSFPPSWIGKVTTTFEILLVVMVVVQAVFPGSGLLLGQKLCSYVVAVFVVLSGFHYSVIMARRLAADSDPR